MAEARKAEIEITYQGKNITTPINEYLENFSYDDVASGESDRINVSLHDINRQWIDAWMPVKGDRISGYLVLHNWNADGEIEKIFCGDFEVDEMSFTGRPMKGEFGAVSIPQNEPFNTQNRTKTWENISIQQMAQEIAGRSGVELYYEAEDIVIEIVEQNNNTDGKFLYSVCKDYGLAMKIYANKIIIFDEEAYENRASVRTIDETDMTKWKYKSTMAGTYTGANMRFTDPNNEEEYLIKIGGGNRILEINENADSIKDAEKKGIAKLNDENKKAITMDITIKTDTKVFAGTCVDITGLGGKIDGKYYVDKAKTTKSGSGACQMQLTIRRVVPRIKTISIGAVEQSAAEIQNGGTAYTVVAGDTLWRIAGEYYGSGVEYQRIYESNKEIIENTAKERGKKDSSNGHWIFPGTILNIPSKE